MKDQTLIITLADGKLIEIPNLNSVDIESIFDAHAKAIEESHSLASERMMRPPLENAFQLFPNSISFIPYPMTIPMIKLPTIFIPKVIKKLSFNLMS